MANLLYSRHIAICCQFSQHSFVGLQHTVKDSDAPSKGFFTGNFSDFGNVSSSDCALTGCYEAYDARLNGDEGGDRDAHFDLIECQIRKFICWNNIIGTVQKLTEVCTVAILIMNTNP